MNALVASLPWSLPVTVTAIISLIGGIFAIRNRRASAKEAAVAAAKAANTLAPPTVGEVWNRMDALESRFDDEHAARIASDEKLEKVAVELDQERKSSALYRSAAGRYFAKLFAALDGARLTIPEPDDDDHAILELTLNPTKGKTS